MSTFSDIFSSIGGDRKAEDALGKQQDGLTKPEPKTGGSVKPTYAGTMSKPSIASSPSIQRPQSADGTSTTGKVSARPAAVATVPPSKPPPKGSYAEIIARAKAAQEQRAGPQVGMIRHQKEQREKVSYLAQRKAADEAKARGGDKQKNRSTSVLNGRIEKRARSHSPMKRLGSSSSKLPEKPARERPPKPSYTGTMRMAPGKPRDKPQSARRKQDEYLGTDEEDNSELEDDIDEEEDYRSDVSSENMEAGAFDIDEEEEAAARAAKIEDAKELALEKKLKAEKEDRRRKLEALSKRAPPQKY